MATEQIPTGLIADDAVTTAKVADDAITGALIENNPTIAGNLTVSGTSTLTGALSVDTISEKTSANGVSVDGLKLKDYSLMYGSNIGLTLDSNGSLTFPNKIWVGPTSSHNAWTTDNSTIPFNEKTYGSTLGKAAFNTTTYKFTAPVAGQYLSIYTGMVNNDSDKNGTSGLQINNSTFGAILYSSTFGNYHNNFCHSQVLTLAVNDTLHWQNFSLNQYLNRGYAQWLIIFLG